MQVSKYLLIPVFLLFSSLAHAQNNRLTLEECLDIALKNNLNVKQTGLTMEQDRIGLSQAKENLLPTINGNISRGLNQGRGVDPVTNTYINQSLTSDNYSLSGSVTLFNGLALQNTIKQTSLAYQAGKMDFKSAKDVVTINVITNYLLILDNEEILAQSKNQLEVAKEQVDRSEILEKDGANKSPSDLYDFRGQLAANKVAVVNAQNSLNAAKLSLFQLMNVSYNKEAEYQPLNAENLVGEYGVSPDKIYEIALQQLPIVKATTLKRESAEKKLQVSKGLLLPSLTISAGISTNYSGAGQRSIFIDSASSPTNFYVNAPSGKQTVYGTQANYSSQNINYSDQFKNNYGSSILLGLNIPIFTNHVKKNNISLAKINLLNSQYIEENTKIQLKQNIEQAWYNMSAAYNKYQALAEQVKAYTESFRISKIRFEAGVLTSVDYIISKNNMDAANLNLISARYDYFIDSKILNYYQGKLSL
jgi:outer membrane protein